MSEQIRQCTVEEIMHKKIEANKVIPDIEGRDIGGAVIHLSNGQPMHTMRFKERHYFVD